YCSSASRRLIEVVEKQASGSLRKLLAYGHSIEVLLPDLQQRHLPVAAIRVDHDPPPLHVHHLYCSYSRELCGSHNPPLWSQVEAVQADA
ncbi:hypothetical protein, partial [Luteolibacter marinus]|uniref:hypothetical protein n=1 Tax=Luteolibacter marinus TaxID=2776705 RepID=UPI001D0230B8